MRVEELVRDKNRLLRSTEMTTVSVSAECSVDIVALHAAMLLRECQLFTKAINAPLLERVVVDGEHVDIDTFEGVDDGDGERVRRVLR